MDKREPRDVCRNEGRHIRFRYPSHVCVPPIPTTPKSMEENITGKHEPIVPRLPKKAHAI